MKIAKKIKPVLILAVISLILIAPNFTENTDNHNVLSHPLSAGDHDPILIDGNSELATFISNEGLSGDGSITTPYIIEDFTIDNITANSIDIRNMDAYLTIQNCVIGGNIFSDYKGILLRNATNVIVTNNSLRNNNYGIYLDNSHNNTLSGNNENNNNIGIVLAESNNNTLFGNNENNINNGIRVSSSHNNTLSGNNVSFHIYDGIKMEWSWNNTIINNNIRYNSDNGIEFTGSCNNSIYENIINSNNYGIFMTVSDNNIIYENDINNNSETGISLWGNDCDNNKIYSNDIFGSKIHQVLEGLGCINQWDNGTTGNYWGDYTQKYPDATNDEIVWNTPYEIDGQGPGIDYFPLVESIFHDFHAPEFLYFPENFTARKGYSNLTISWNATDLHPDTYIIELNGTKMVEATTWNNGTEIFYNIPDGLLEGIHNITIFISDESGNISFHTVLFIVNNNISGFPLFSIILFISVSVYLLKMKVDHRK